MTAAAVFYRISDPDAGQQTANQVPDVQRFVQHHGYEVTRTYTVTDSAWKLGPEYRKALQQALDDAHAGHFKVIIVWALDRIVRNGEGDIGGAEATLALIRQFRQRGVMLVSIRESWLNSAPEVQDVLVAFAGWMAEQESKRKSERVRAGIARRKAQGLAFGGRKPGSKNRPKVAA